MTIFILIFILFCIVLFYKDFANYRYAVKCFKLILQNEALRKKYPTIGISKFGSLYYWHTIGTDIEETYHKDLLFGNVQMIDEALSMMTLDGVITLKHDLIKIDDTKYYYLIKFVPIFNKVNIKSLVISLVISYVLTLIIVKFNIFDKIDISLLKLW